MKCEFKHQDLFGLKLGQYESFSPIWSCVSRERDTTSSVWKFKLDNLEGKGLGSNLKMQ